MPLGRIHGTTTLGELALRRGQLGVQHISIAYDLGLAQPVRVVLSTDHCRVVGRGETEAEALDDAFSRLMHIVGEETSTGVSAV